MHFFISHLARCLRTRRFSEPTFRPSGATNHWKNTVNRDFPTFSRICIFFLLIFSLLTLLTSAFQLSILSEVSLLNFLRSYHILSIYLPIYLSTIFPSIYLCGAKHIGKSTCTKQSRCGPLLALEMSKKCTPLWREAHFEVKMYKTHHCRTTFGS